MEVKVLNEEKNVIEVEIGNLTVAEIIREYLNKDKSVKFAAWNRKHPSENPKLRVEANDPKKAIKSAIEAISKDVDSFNSIVKKA